MAAGGPYVLSVSANGSTTSLNDILVGDVFLCGGQSNMELTVANATSAPMDRSERMVELDLSVIGARKSVMITDGAVQREFGQKELAFGKTRVTLKPRGGFLAVFH